MKSLFSPSFQRFIVISLYVLLSFFAYQCTNSIASDSNESKPLTYPNGNDYKTEWSEVKLLEEKGLTKSALELVNKIHLQAKKENNHQQIVKTLIVKAKLETPLQEDAFVKTIQALHATVEQSAYPLTPLLHSIIAELYWKYYQNNRWRFQNRSTTLNFEHDNINTWSLKQIIATSTQHYLLSIQNINDLKRTSINTYNAIIVDNEENHYRPYLYDFLAHRAVDFFMHEEPNITHPVYQFRLDDPTYLSSYDVFTALALSTKDTNSLKFHALNTLQKLTKTHINDNNPQALIDVELKRLLFVKNNATFPEKDSIYTFSLEQLYKEFKTNSASTEIAYELAREYYERGMRYDPVKSPQQQWELKKALELCEQAIKNYESSYGAKKCLQLSQQIKGITLSVVTERINSPNLPFRGKVTFKNASTAHFKLVKMDYSHYQEMANNPNKDEHLKRINALPSLKNWQLDLKDEGDYQTHSGTFKIDALPLGFYVLVASTDKNFIDKKEITTIVPIWISNLSYLNRKNHLGENEFMVMQRETGKPIQGVKAEVYINQYNKVLRKQEKKRITTVSTNENGSFTIPHLKPYTNFQVHFTHGKDRLISHDNYYQHKQNNNSSRKFNRTLFFLDREIYRPGQTVYFKGMVLETDEKNNNELKTQLPSTVVLYDVNHQKVTELNVVTNAFGTFSGSFILPSSGLNGQMRIENEYGSKFFTVEAYKRPTFEASFNPIEGSYQLDKNVTVTGKARTYAGAALDGAQVKYRVVRTGITPYRCFYRWGFWPQSEKMEIAQGTTKTDQNGLFSIDFAALGDAALLKKYEPTYHFTVYADITDINGETHSATTTIRISDKALKVAIDIPEMLEKTQKDTFALSITNLSDEPEKAEGTIKIWALEMPSNYYRKSLWPNGDKKYLTEHDHRNSFPLDAYDQENNKYRWKKGKMTYNQSFNTAINSSVTLSDIALWENGEYVCEIATTDRYGKSILERKYFTIYDSKSKNCPTNSINWFVPVKNTCEPGDKAIFVVGSASSNAWIRYEIEHEGKITSQEWIKLKDAEQRRIEIPVQEKHRGNFQVHFTLVKHGRSYSNTETIYVPYTNKELNIEFETLRNKLLPGEKEEWKIKIKGNKGEQVAAEMVATLYDASLDAFRPNNWLVDLLHYNRSQRNWILGTSFTLSNGFFVNRQWGPHVNVPPKKYARLNWFGYHYGIGRYRNYYSRGALMEKAAMSVMEDDMVNIDHSEGQNEAITSVSPSKKENMERTANTGNDVEHIKVRKNFNETAFFLPHLTTNEQGEITIKFTIPESLTKWKFMGLAHSQDLKVGRINEEVVTQKKLMVYPNLPRFFRENDTTSLAVKITNQSTEHLTGKAHVFFYDALTMQPIKDLLPLHSVNLPFEMKAGKSATVKWDICVPEKYAAITCKVVAQSGKFTDGEEMAIPVLKNRMLVTESMPLPIRGKQTKTFTLNKLQNNTSSTLKNHQLTLEFTSNPSWYAIQALPYLMEPAYPCTEQIFSRYYANAMAGYIVNANPRVKNVFNHWKNASPETFLSNLEKNQTLKALVLEETPWVLNAKNEEEQKKRIAILFDLAKMEHEGAKTIQKLLQTQTSSGAWPWFKGMKENRYITQHIVSGMGHLHHLGIKSLQNNPNVWSMIEKAVAYLDAKISRDYEWLKKHSVDLKAKNINRQQIQYLYARSFFLSEIAVQQKNKEAYHYYLNQAKVHWLKEHKYMQGMVALALNRNGETATAKQIMASLKENAIYNEELGMYWKDIDGGYSWHQAPIEAQALLIAAFNEVSNDKESVEEMKIWLLKQKQTQHWKTSKATVEACYALLSTGSNLLAHNGAVTIKVGKEMIDPFKKQDLEVEAGTGYFKTAWSKESISPEMATVNVTKSDEGIAWGALYWQYFEQLDKISSNNTTPLKLKKKLFIQHNKASGPIIEPIESSTSINPSNIIVVRIELKVDRDMEYVHMKDMRAAGVEPLNVFSGYRYQDGLGYYQSTKDAATHFFFDYLPKGSYVFEYSLRANLCGNFSNGITSIQSMYAPEFSSHSEGVRLKIIKEE